jgi:hypothetical protein
MRSKLMHSIRILLTLGLLFGVYKETGIWTTISIGLVFLTLELTGILFHRILRVLNVKLG